MSMKSSFPALALCAVLAVAGGCREKQVDVISPEDFARIEELHQAEKQAVLDGDMAALISLWTEDGVILAPGERPYVGKDAVRVYFRKIMDETAEYAVVAFEQDFKEVKLLGEWAFEWAIRTLSLEHRESGLTMESADKLFRVLQKQADGTWKVARGVWTDDAV